MLSMFNLRANFKAIQTFIVSALWIGVSSLLGYRLVLYPSSALLLLLVGLLGLVLILWQPIAGIVAYMLIYPTIRSDASLNATKVSMLALFTLLMVLWLWRKIRNGDYVWKQKPYRWLFLFFVYISFSPFLGMINGFSVFDWSRDIAPLLNLLLIPVFADYFKQKEYRWLLYVLFLPAGLGVAQFLGSLLTDYGVRIGFVLGHIPFRISTFHPAMLLGIGVVMFLQKAPQRALWLVLAFLGFATGILTSTRTVWFSLAMMLFLLIFFYGRHRIKTIALICCGLLVVWNLFTQQESRMEYRYAQESRIRGMVGQQRDYSVDNRVAEAQQSYEYFLASPVVGMGYGYQYHFWRPLIAIKGTAGYMDTNYTHNDFLNLMAKGGLLGLLLFAMALRGLLKELYRRYKAYRGSLISAWAMIGILGIVESLMVGLSTPVYQERMPIYFLTVILAIALSYGSDEADDEKLRTG